MVLLDEHYYLHLQTHSHHSHQAPKLNVDSRGVVFAHVVSSGDQWAEYLKGVPTCEKGIGLHGHLKQDIPGHKQGNHAPMLCPKPEALDGTPEEDIPNGALSGTHYGIHISVA